MGDVSCNILIVVFYVSLICIGSYHVKYLLWKKNLALDQVTHVNQLLSIMYLEMFTLYTQSFDKVWHKVPIFKLNSVGLLDSLLHLIESFLSSRFQRMLLNGQTSDWSGKTDVPQGFILAALTSFSFIYINDLSNNLLSTTNLLEL